MPIEYTPGEVEQQLSEPSEALVASMVQSSGDLLLLGAGGKMGTTLALMAKKAIQAAGQSRRVLAASRYRNPAVRQTLESAGVHTLAGDLFSTEFLDSLPDADTVVQMVGHKFGTSGDAGPTWATNAFLPGLLCRRFTQCRLIAFSTGNVYPLVPIASGGSIESDPLAPVGEYAMSALARERIIHHFTTAMNIPTVLLRLNYSTELRYGVLIDLARQVISGSPVSLSMGYFNCIWQRDACDLALRSLPHASNPPRVFNLTGRETLSVRAVATAMGELLGIRPEFVGEEAPTALLSNSHRTCECLGDPQTNTDAMIRHTCEWLRNGYPTWDKPTHFETRDGKF
ncbi:MAG: NAD(P)-dependent oxidoreductase [Planctomycetales bacterium]|nr:NAD(P)-dependent oxidoreductase [Planctomycetales bacterium]